MKFNKDEQETVMILTLKLDAGIVVQMFLVIFDCLLRK